MRRKPPEPSTHDRVLGKAWRRAVVFPGARCLMCGRDHALFGHHVISQRIIEDYGREHGLEPQGIQLLLWDSRNGIPLDLRCHERHHNAYRRIPLYLLPACVFEFARDLDALYADGRQPIHERLRREYPDA